MTGIRRALRATRPLPRAVLGLACAAALAAFAWPIGVEPAPEAPARPFDSQPGAASSGAALRRPLFDPGRRDWTARGSRAAILEGEPRRPVLTVRGIVVDGGKARVLIDDGSGDERWLGPGEGRYNWRITAIAPDSVTLDQNGRPFTAAFMGQPVTLRPLPLEPALRN
ncbi:hypothetical protein ACWFZ6_18865 [Methylorubrum extorquens]|uniref:DUF4115 domain-containing protein n=1 Tax=Methylorubrum extorquens (strain ATCC 14718 / DSM 1338 / JCM 2805 / NCIMB 9133 / AM1) TaxID=272630 RepID=C5B372_METEA|nr:MULTISPECIES: hypothetical protein [Methylorubrum]ACS38018.1 exported hypothetical protein [Methylorubrum extorquens AM1]MCP1543941.1 hypothetical protein [Methylorubrum extorquens]MCP1588713.1 hypothetical protein [Methylorubrum extorquens]BDL37456.1 hypothetical protein MSPGM_00460 [Methylorubrum sp. GM97]